MVTAVARVGRKKISPYFAGGGAVSTAYEAFCMFSVSLTVNYLVIPFQVRAAGAWCAGVSYGVPPASVRFCGIKYCCCVVSFGASSDGGESKAQRGMFIDFFMLLLSLLLLMFS